jgi:hypothetical protein
MSDPYRHNAKLYPGKRKNRFQTTKSGLFFLKTPARPHDYAKATTGELNGRSDFAHTYFILAIAYLLTISTAPLLF